MNNRKYLIYPKNREKVQWKVPALFNNDEAALILNDVCEELGIRKPIQSVYGSIMCSWGGGRASKIKELDEKKAEQIINDFNNRNISCCFTFSAARITKEELEDKTGNALLKMASNSSYQNYAIVTSDLLTDYIRDKYPNIKLISSILRPVYEIDDYNETPDYYNELCKRYDKVVIRPDFCFDNRYLKKLKYKNKIEILANLTCLSKCVLSRKHYDLASDQEKGIRTDFDFDFCNKEMRNVQSVFNTNVLSREDIDRLVKLGFTNFKLKGRNSGAYIFLDTLSRYIFEPTGISQNISRLVGLKLEQFGIDPFNNG